MNKQGRRIVTSLRGGCRPAFLPWALLLRRVGLGAVGMVGLSLAVTLSGSPAQAQIDPRQVITANRFSITIDGYQIATFQELQGITSEVEATEYWEVNGDNVTVHKLPGKMPPATITLKRGMNGSLELWSWHEAVRQGNMAAARRSATLTMFNSEGRPVGKYWLEKAWPSKMDLAGLKAGASEALIETVTFHCENIQRIAP